MIGGEACPIEIINRKAAFGRARYALFDFDGTLSLIRAGWQDVMVSMMVNVLKDTPVGRTESDASIRLLVGNYVTYLTGRQTIYQMIRLQEEVRKRRGASLNPLQYKHHYHERLSKRISGRLRGLKTGQISPDSLMVPGARAMLDQAHRHGVVCLLASGTDEMFVHEEARLLRIDGCFEEIYGAVDNWETYSKRAVICQIIHDNQLEGAELVSFGDGFVEIKEAKLVGAIAVGVASNEAHRGQVDRWKRTRLFQAGADVITADFRHHTELSTKLFASPCLKS